MILLLLPADRWIGNRGTRLNVVLAAYIFEVRDIRFDAIFQFTQSNGQVEKEIFRVAISGLFFEPLK